MKTKTRIFILLLLSVVAAMGLQSCIEDSVSTSAADQPEFSVDTLDMGTVFSSVPTVTSSFMVYNRHPKVMSISSIAFSDNDDAAFRINVDGRAGSTFANVEIRPNDSIYVFVEATLPASGMWSPVKRGATLDFVTNGITRSVRIEASGQDVERLHGLTVTRDTTFTGDRPRQVFDSLVVAPGATLRLEPGVKLHFHDKSFLRVDGTLLAEGTPERPIDMGGDRTGNVVADISFEIMASQWEGVTFSPSSCGSRMAYTTVRNTVGGVRLDSLAGSALPEAPALELVNCRLRNSAGYALEAIHADVTATGCELADAAMGCVRLVGGSHRLTHCTIANYYLFAALGGAALQLEHAEQGGLLQTAPLMKAEISNTIIYGNGAYLSLGDLDKTEVYLRRCLLKSNGSDDAHFVDCLWGEDPLYFTVREEYIFDYRLREGSPAIGAASPALTPATWTTDFYGTPVPSPADLGAYARAE